MHGKVLIIDNAGKRHGVEDIHENIIQLFIILVNYFLSKSKVLGHTPRFVITSEKNNFLRVAYLKGKKNDQNSCTKNTSVNVVSEEQVIDILGVPSLVEHVAEIVVLTVEVTNNDNRLSNSHEIWLFLHYVNCHLTKEFNLLLG